MSPMSGFGRFSCPQRTDDNFSKSWLKQIVQNAYLENQNRSVLLPETALLTNL